ncbi:MAG: peptidoglycan DD-metalloendopeptidase family protein [Pseudomonadota bacterium]
MTAALSRLQALGLACLLAAALAGCSSAPRKPAPVEDRGAAAGRLGPVAPAPAPVASPADAPKPLPGAENAGKPGYYTVRPGDTLMRIGLETGQSWRDLARWNNLDNPNQIEVGQVLRVVPPVAGAPSSVAAAPAPSPSAAQAPAPAPAASGVVTRPVSSGSVAVAPVAPGASGAASGASAPAAAPAPAPAPAAEADEIAFIWPAQGALIAGFDEQKNKGLDIAGKPGDPVVAAADGRVVYAGAGLRGYGNLIILKHNNTFLTAYAHNQTLLVKEDQTVRKGQKIAELGASDADRPKLHFEIRRQGKPVDPAKYLPAR